MPILGAIADYSNLKKRLMTIFCYLGVLASALLFFITESSYIFGGVLLIIANLCFGAANIFYNSYLVDLTTEDKRDSISSYGFALGYAGGIIMLVLNILLVQNAESFRFDDRNGRSFVTAGGFAVVGNFRVIYIFPHQITRRDEKFAGRKKRDCDGFYGTRQHF